MVAYVASLAKSKNKKQKNFETIMCGTSYTGCYSQLGFFQQYVHIDLYVYFIYDHWSSSIESEAFKSTSATIFWRCLSLVSDYGMWNHLFIFLSIWLVITDTDNTKLWHDPSLFPLGKSLPDPPTCSRDDTCKPPQRSSVTLHSQWVIFENIWLDQKSSNLWSVKIWDI